MLSEEMSQRLQDDFDLRSETYYPEVSLENRTAEQKRLEGDRELDVKGVGPTVRSRVFFERIFLETPQSQNAVCAVRTTPLDSLLPLI